MDEYEYEAIPSAQAQKRRERAEVRAAGRGWLYVVASAATGAAFLAFAAYLVTLAHPAESDFTFLGAMLIGVVIGGCAGYWIRGLLANR